jgi:hypothetical protein
MKWMLFYLTLSVNISLPGMNGLSGMIPLPLLMDLILSGGLFRYLPWPASLALNDVSGMN